MVRVKTSWGFYQEPPYTEEELADFYRRTGNIVGFTRIAPRVADGQAASPPDTEPNARPGEE